MQIQSAEQIDIIKVTLFSERFREGTVLHFAGIETDAPTALEINVYETLTLPYLTGSLVLQDDNDVYRLARLNGTERLKVILKNPSDNSAGFIEKTFMLTSIKKSAKSTDTATLLFIQLIENHAYFSQLRPFNKSYTGTGPVIVEKILKDHLNVKIYPDYWKQPYGHDFRFIVPWQDPFTACKSIVNGLATDNGLPYFLTATLTKQERILTDLESILTREAFNKGNPFVYSKGATPLAGGRQILSPEDKALIIADYRSTDLEETLSMAQRGAIGSSYSHVNINSGEPYEQRINMEEEFKNLEAREILPRGMKIPVDTKFRELPDGPKNIALPDYNSRRFFTFSENPFIDTQTMYNDLVNVRLSIIKNNFVKYLLRNVHEVYVPGLLFSTTNIATAVGHQVEIQLLQSNPGEAESVSSDDEKRSGTYVMLAKRHIFNLVDGRHNVAMSIGRLAERAVQA